MSKVIQPRPILWLPSGSSVDCPKSLGWLDFIGVTLSYKQIYGTEPNWDDLQRELAPYSLERIVDTICRINATLQKASLPWEAEPHRQICLGIFDDNEAKRIFHVAKSFEQKLHQQGNAGYSRLMLFNEQQTLNLLKAAFLIKETPTADTSENLNGIGKALLIISDLTEPNDLLGTDPNAPDYLDRWLKYILPLTLWTSINQADSYAPIARSFDLYLQDKPELSNCGCYIDLPERIRTICGLEPIPLWSATLALAAHWSNLSPKTIAEKAMYLHRSSYFTDKFKFSNEEIEGFYALHEISASNLSKIITDSFSKDELKSFDFLPFARTPLVSFDDRIYAMSVTLLWQKLATGLHHLHLDKHLQHAENQLYLTYMGEVFEDYIHRALKRMFPPSSGRYLRMDDLTNIKGKYCDGLVTYADAVLLIETKASLFAFEARVGHSMKQARERLQDIYLDAGKQLDQTIKAIEQGRLKDPEGVIPKDIKRYYPIVVTLENIQMNPIIHGEVKRILKRERLLNRANIAPLQSVDVSEFEQIETVLTYGVNLRALLDEKLNSKAEIEDSWDHFLYRYRRSNNLPHRNNEFLNKAYSKISDNMKKFFKARDIVSS